MSRLTSFILAGCLLATAGCGGEDCKPRATTYCEEGVLYWVDSCGTIGGKKSTCPCGCTAERTACEDCGCTSNADCTALYGPGYYCDLTTHQCQPEGCTPDTCNELGYECGNWSDGCGGTLDCGGCPGSMICQHGECICTEHDDCDDQSICVYGTCTLAYGRSYQLTVLEVEISELDQNGENWDAMGGAPDPIVCFFEGIQGNPQSLAEAVFCTSAIQDRHTCTFNQGFETPLYASDDWLIVAYDEDLTDYELIEGGRAAPIEVDWIKSGGFKFEGDYLEYCLVSIEVVE